MLASRIVLSITGHYFMSCMKPTVKARGTAVTAAAPSAAQKVLQWEPATSTPPLILVVCALAPYDATAVLLQAPPYSLLLRWEGFLKLS